MKSFFEKPLHILSIASLFCIVLVLGRCALFGGLHYLFLGWNLFLAWLPVFFILCLRASEKRGDHWLLRLLLFGGWMAFLPNSPYILTDLFHLRAKLEPLWLNWLILLSFGWTGLLLGLWSLRQARGWVHAKFGANAARFFVPLMIVACAYGVYLGRFERWNSWDLLTDPLGIAGDMLASLGSPRAIGMTVLFSLFLAFAWWSFGPLFQKEQDEHET